VEVDAAIPAGASLAVEKNLVRWGRASQVWIALLSTAAGDSGEADTWNELANH
jgi:hypothetical protein